MLFGRLLCKRLARLTTSIAATRLARSVILPSVHSTALKRMAACSAQHPRLDRAAFERVLQLTALKLPAKDCHTVIKAFAGYTLDRPRMRPIVLDPSDTSIRLMLLEEGVKGAELSGLRDDLRRLVQQQGYEVVQHDVQMDYSHFNTDQILKVLLPEAMEIPGAFEGIGHIAHLNLKDEWLPYKHIIGQVILDKNHHIKTVINKIGNVENEFRVFEMEVLAGEAHFETEVKQHGARFRLNFAKVYWNSRLEQEHSRLVSLFKPGQVIADVMAGIGPFAIPAAQKRCKVLANDLNPQSFHYLEENININKVRDRVQAFNMDGEAFIRAACNGSLHAVVTGCEASQQQQGCGRTFFDHAVMNLPASAVSFLTAFRGACSHSTWFGPLPTIHCYTFSIGSENEAGVRSRLEAALQGRLDAAPDIHIVRNVAPNKRMLCASFALPASIAFAEAPQRNREEQSNCSYEPMTKRQCLKQQ